MWLSGTVAKFPGKATANNVDTTKDYCSTDNGPIGNVVFSFWKSLKFIVAHPVEIPNANVNILPNLEKM